MNKNRDDIRQSNIKKLEEIRRRRALRLAKQAEQQALNTPETNTKTNKEQPITVDDFLKSTVELQKPEPVPTDAFVSPPDPIDTPLSKDEIVEHTVEKEQLLTEDEIEQYNKELLSRRRTFFGILAITLTFICFGLLIKFSGATDKSEITSSDNSNIPEQWTEYTTKIVPPQNKDKTQPVSQVIEVTSIKENTYLDKVTKDLDKKAKLNQLPYEVTLETLGGDYILGLTTYYPKQPNKMYIDFAMINPEKKKEPLNDKMAQKINKKLSEKLPVINETIKVKDGKKVKIETYKMKDETYQSILLYDNQPFAYVTTDKDLNMVNHVTTYYVSDIEND